MSTPTCIHPCAQRHRPFDNSKGGDRAALGHSEALQLAASRFKTRGRQRVSHHFSRAFRHGVWFVQDAS